MLVHRCESVSFTIPTAWVLPSMKTHEDRTIHLDQLTEQLRFFGVYQNCPKTDMSPKGARVLSFQAQAYNNICHLHKHYLPFKREYKRSTWKKKCLLQCQGKEFLFYTK